MGGRKQRKLARALIDEGDDIARNGRELCELGGDDWPEGRMRELAGGALAGVGSVMLLQERHESFLRSVRLIRRRLLLALRRQKYGGGS